MDVEQRARGLLAAEYERYGDMIGAAKALEQMPADGVTIRAIIAALTPPAGFVLVPVEPTEEMVEAVRSVCVGGSKVPRAATSAIRYKAMLAARPEVKP